MLCYVVAYLDRVNIGIAKLNMLADLQFSEAAYGLGAGLFFIGYMLFEVPSNLIMHRVGARLWIARIMISWGLLSGVMAFVTTPWQFYTVRFLLGVAEAGFYPGVILYLTYWFPNRRRAKVTAIFQAGIPIAGLLGSPLSGWILERFHQVGGHAGWQWVFVLEALPTLPLAIGVLWILTDRVKDAKWLTPAQRQLIENDIAQDDHGREHMPLTGILRDMRICKIILMTFPAMMALYTLGFYLPTLIKDAGAVSGVQIGLLSAIPYCVAVVAMVLVGRSSDRHGERRWHLAGIMLVGAFGLVASVFAGQNLVLAVISLSIAAAGIISFSPIMWTLPTAFLGGATAAACIGAINSLANLGGFVSPYLIGWIRDTYHSTAPAIFIIAGALVAGALVALSFDPKKVNR
ncbi:MFS transporter [Cupriavidus sp. L7L]|nr:MFS transporter [Cupriavidus sp. L7L]